MSISKGYTVSTVKHRNRLQAPETGHSRAFYPLFFFVINLTQSLGAQALSTRHYLPGSHEADLQPVSPPEGTGLGISHLGGGSPLLAEREEVKAGRTPLPTTKFPSSIYSHQSPTPLPKSLKTEKIKFSKRGGPWNVVSTPINIEMLKMGISVKNALFGVSTGAFHHSLEQNISQS